MHDLGCLVRDIGNTVLRDNDLREVGAMCSKLAQIHLVPLGSFHCVRSRRKSCALNAQAGETTLTLLLLCYRSVSLSLKCDLLLRIVGKIDRKA